MHITISSRTARIVATTMALAMVGTQPAIAGSCTMSNQMSTAAQNEQTRRQNDLDIRTQQLQLLNDLQRACLENFPDYPTDYLPDSTIMVAVFNKLKAASCNGLTQKARQTSNDAISAARAAAQAQIDKVQQSIVSTNPTLLQPVSSQLGSASNAILSTTSSSSQSGSSSGILSSVLGLFK